VLLSGKAREGKGEFLNESLVQARGSSCKFPDVKEDTVVSSKEKNKLAYMGERNLYESNRGKGGLHKRGKSPGCGHPESATFAQLQRGRLLPIGNAGEKREPDHGLHNKEKRFPSTLLAEERYYILCYKRGGMHGLNEGQVTRRRDSV